MASTWVNDFDSHAAGSDGPSTQSGIKPGRPAHRALTRKEKIQEELKLLEWHKLANESALKAALMQNRQLKNMQPEHVPAHAADDARWIKKVIEQEHIKPLEVSKDYVLEYEKREQENQERLAAQVERHISTLKTLREKLETRADLKSRTDDYRQWQKDFSTKKQAVMIGKTLEEVEAERLAGLNGPQTDTSHASSAKKKIQQAVGTSQELSNVLESLNKLAELENRITSLEKDNVYEKMLSSERPKAGDRTVLDFRKARQAVDKGPTALVYAMKPKKTSWQVQVPNNRLAGGAGAAAVRAAKQGATFLTGNDDSYEVDPDERRRERARQMELAPPGQKQLRARVQNKRARAKELSTGARRHEEALKELNKRRNEQQIQKRPPRGIAGAAAHGRGGGGAGTGGVAARGAASGIRNKNKHLQDFEKLKSGFKKRREELSGGPPRARGAGAGLSAVRAVSKTAPASYSGNGGGGAHAGYGRGNNNNNSSNNGYGGGRQGGGAYQGQNQNQNQGQGVGQRGMTRRTNEPQNPRGYGNPTSNPRGNGIGSGIGGAPGSAPAAVLGIGGVRAIRSQRG